MVNKDTIERKIAVYEFRKKISSFGNFEYMVPI